MIGLADSSKLGEEICCVEGKSLDVSKISIKGIHEATILGRKEVCDEYSIIGISELIPEGFKKVALLSLI